MMISSRPMTQVSAMGDPASTWYSSPPWTYLQIKYLTFHNTWDFYWAFGDSSPLSSMIPYPNMQTQIWLFQSQPSTKCVNTFTAVFRSTYCWRDIDKDSNAIITVVVNLNICLWIDDVQLYPPWYWAQWGWHLVFVFNLQLRQHCIYTFSRTMQIHVNHNLYLSFYLAFVDTRVTVLCVFDLEIQILNFRAIKCCFAMILDFDTSKGVSLDNYWLFVWFDLHPRALQDKKGGIVDTLA